MARGDLPALVGLRAADQPERWAALGFRLEHDRSLWIGAVRVSFEPHATPPVAALLGWTLAGGGRVPDDLDGIATAHGAAARAPAATPAHPNGALRLDHVVITTPDLPRTLLALTRIGLQISRTRETRLAGPRARQAFLWAGDVVLEIVGPADAAGEGPAQLWGMVVVTDAIDDLEQITGSLVSPAKDAVQPGRRIASVRRDAGLGARLAFMTPHRAGGTPAQGGVPA